jgi:hypothetical protein
LKRKLNFPFYKTTYLNEEVNCTEPSVSIRVPWSNHSWETQLFNQEERKKFSVLTIGLF